MDVVKNIINATIYNVRTKLNPDHPFIIEDHGNDIEIVCNWKCYLKYKHID